MMKKGNSTSCPYYSNRLCSTRDLVALVDNIFTENIKKLSKLSSQWKTDISADIIQNGILYSYRHYRYTFQSQISNVMKIRYATVIWQSCIFIEVIKNRCLLYCIGDCATCHWMTSNGNMHRITSEDTYQSFCQWR